MSRNKSKGSAVSRLQSDYIRMKKDPVPYIVAEPLPYNIFEWPVLHIQHRSISLPRKNSPYEGGYYHGRLVFPPDFPFKPPSIYMHTPNGRFKTHTRLCLSISDFHPDTWNPAWNASAILTGLLSFMLEENSQTYGSIVTSNWDKRVFSQQSLEHNLNDETFIELFPSIVKDIREELQKRKHAETGRTTSRQGAGSPDVNIQNPSVAGPQSPFYSALANMAVFASVALFAYIIRFVIHNVQAE
ncbi:unnamed protein product [Darwinula stevensoni]|uniref:UBC core domain-containing protein n=1 Tax=Darwinula stevensoni TaxID=69355 RepID=A0A7R8XFJ5_9CRUS|nr:unnamed protein product [Darwinula stevensoni]CAG0895125.1 unnamed protein product [Darwinula stevensoni]